MDLPVTKKSRLALLLIPVALLTIGGAFWYLNRPGPSAEAVAIRYRDCLRQGNGGCLYALTPEDDRKLLGMSSDQMARFAREWIRPKYGGLLVDPKPDVSGDPRSAWQMFTWQVATKDGVKPLSVLVAKTNDGLQVVNGLPMLVLAEFARSGDGAAPSGLTKLRNWSVNARTQGPELRKYGFNSMRLEASGRPMTIAEFAAFSEERLARAEATPRR